MSALPSTIREIIFTELGLDGQRDDDHEAAQRATNRIMKAIEDYRVEAGARACLAELVASKTLITEEHMLGVFYRGRLSGGQRETRELLAAVKSRVDALD